MKVEDDSDDGRKISDSESQGLNRDGSVKK